MSVTVDFPSTPTRKKLNKAEDRQKSERLLRERMIGMLCGMVFAHVYLGIAISQSYIDDSNQMHTCWIALVGTFICSLVFLYHMGISTSGRRSSPFLSTSLWVLVLLDIAVMSIIQSRAFFAPYAVWAWPSVLITGVIGYIVGPVLDRVFGKLLRLN